MSDADFLSVTEVRGDEVTREQVERACHRYHWAGCHCRGKAVLEAACGTGQGLGLLSGLSASLLAGDFSLGLLRLAAGRYGGRVPMLRFDAQQLPLRDGSVDVIVLLEAIYYLVDACGFTDECRRALRRPGVLLLATANKDLYDFAPSPHSHRYFGVPELAELLAERGFDVECFGAFPIGMASLRQRVLRPVKKAAVVLNLMPATMAGKKLLKRLVFGGLVPMPADVSEVEYDYVQPTALPLDRPDRQHQVIYCAGTLTR